MKVQSHVDSSRVDAKTPKKFKDMINTTWGTIISGISLFSFGFGGGCYVTNTMSAIKHNDEIMKLNREILTITDNADKESHELRNQIYELQSELLNLKQKTNEETN